MKILGVKGLKKKGILVYFLHIVLKNDKRAVIQFITKISVIRNLAKLLQIPSSKGIQFFLHVKNVYYESINQKMS